MLARRNKLKEYNMRLLEILRRCANERQARDEAGEYLRNRNINGVVKKIRATEEYEDGDIEIVIIVGGEIVTVQVDCSGHVKGNETIEIIN